MKKLRKTFMVLVNIFICLFLISCQGLADYVIDLPGGYTIIRTSGHEVKIAPRISDDVFGSSTVPPKVIKVAWNEDYILAKQLNLVEDTNSSNGYKIPDEKISFYWIIEIKLNKVLGPLTIDEFNKQKKELGIPKNLILKNVEEL